MYREVYLSAPSSGYGHLSYGHHDGYSDHHGYTDHHVTYGSYSGYDCCPLVVDSLSLIALIGFIALATYFFRIQIINSMLAKKRRRRDVNLNSIILLDWTFQGRHTNSKSRK